MKELKPKKDLKFAKERIFENTPNVSFDTLPGCIGYYKHPTPPNNCETCRCDFLCKRCIPKRILDIIFQEQKNAR